MITKDEDFYSVSCDFCGECDGNEVTFDEIKKWKLKNWAYVNFHNQFKDVCPSCYEGLGKK